MVLKESKRIGNMFPKYNLYKKNVPPNVNHAKKINK